MMNGATSFFVLAFVFGAVSALIYLYCWIISKRSNVGRPYRDWKDGSRIDSGLTDQDEKPPKNCCEGVEVIKSELAETETCSISETGSVERCVPNNSTSSSIPSTITIEQRASPSPSSDKQKGEKMPRRDSTTPYPLGEPNMPLPGVTFIEWTQPSPDSDIADSSGDLSQELPPLYRDVLAGVPKSESPVSK